MLAFGGDSFCRDLIAAHKTLGVHDFVGNGTLGAIFRFQFSFKEGRHQKNSGTITSTFPVGALEKVMVSTVPFNEPVAPDIDPTDVGLNALNENPGCIGAWTISTSTGASSKLTENTVATPSPLIGTNTVRLIVIAILSPSLWNPKIEQ